MHFSREIHSKLQVTRVPFPSKPGVGTLMGFSLTVEGNLCPVFRGPDVYFARPECEDICIHFEARRSARVQVPSA